MTMHDMIARPETQLAKHVWLWTATSSQKHYSRIRYWLRNVSCLHFWC